ncbi:MAG: molybdopterin synthase sulfur carrier subunit [Enterobacteriaceae bacterium]|jgi:molybdopterin synthase sulfur carrier subunit|nr:molybdopterin synthase sulfur carrier subunit [Enterobacteriaceae bacterium]
MIDVVFFAQVREQVGTDRLEISAEYSTVEELRQALCAHGDKWALALNSGTLLMAVNQTLVMPDHPIIDGDEIAFFPPVTGG